MEQNYRHSDNKIIAVFRLLAILLCTKLCMHNVDLTRSISIHANTVSIESIACGSLSIVMYTEQ